METWEVRGTYTSGPEGRFAAFLLDLEKEIAWRTGVTVTGLNVKQRSDGWVLVLKGEQKGVPLVMFVDGDSFMDCYRNLWTVVKWSSWQWRKDRFP